MPFTHNWELKVGEYTFEGECEITDAGMLAFTQTGESEMSLKTKEAVRSVLETLGPLPATYSDLKKFELKVK